MKASSDSSSSNQVIAYSSQANLSDEALGLIALSKSAGYLCQVPSVS